jgi:hypothetical protein
MYSRLSVLAVCGLLLAVPPAGAETAAPAVTAGEVADVVFKAAERKAIEKFFGKKARVVKDGKGAEKGLPPGLARKGQLPPGLAKRDQLPPGLAKRGLPSALEKRLGPPPAGSRRVIVDKDVVLIEEATDRVLDILYDVVTEKTRK